MGRISLLGTGNIAFSGSEMHTTNNSDMLFGNSLVPTTISTFSIGSSANPFKTLFISASTLQMAAPPGGNSLSILNDGSNFQITNGGLRSTVIFTGGLLLSGNNIGADPLFSNHPMTIGTNGLSALQILVSTTSTSTISTTNVMYASGGNSNLWNSAYNNQTNYLPISGGTITGNLTVYGGTSAVSLTASRVQIGAKGDSFTAFHTGSGQFVVIGGGPGAYAAAAVNDVNVTTSSKVFVQSIGVTDDKKIPSISVVTSTGSLTAYSSINNDTSKFSYFFINP